MLIKMTSKLTGQLNVMDIPLTETEFEAAMATWKRGSLVQEAFPTLTKDEREFLMTGSTPEEWNEVFGEEDPDE